MISRRIFMSTWRRILKNVTEFKEDIPDSLGETVNDPHGLIGRHIRRIWSGGYTRSLVSVLVYKYI